MMVIDVLVSGTVFGIAVVIVVTGRVVINVENLDVIRGNVLILEVESRLSKNGCECPCQIILKQVIHILLVGRSVPNEVRKRPRR